MLADLAATKLRPRGPSHSGRLRGLIGQRLAAGVTRAEIAEDARSVTIDPLDPPAMFATAVRREPWSAPAPVARPDWCGVCDEPTRLREDDQGRALRCPECHPLVVAP